ncbi:HAD hydrolase-like protein [Nakamurella sp. YIM 132084]|uniref:HAD hydrolase-like protein n=1 Tax=Nakamurella leprariae TaxID=2803911 RepID=A0A938YK23_9ACTN|nr:HAD hydrolase-like protein [Nakamurella leprariae]
MAEQYDALLLDLDGTVYLGGQPVRYAVESIEQARALGAHPVYVTNNASRPPAEVAASLTGMELTATDHDVLTSPEAATAMLAGSHPAGSPVLVVGAPWLAECVEQAGLRPVRTFADDPVAVVQGHSPETGWPQLAEACLALRAGADWVACNVDSTLPTDRGLLPGNGAMVAALVAATTLRPRVAGKPGRALLDTAVERLGATRPLVVGDRLDTDIEAGATAGLPSLLVLTGVSTAVELLTAPEHQHPTWLAFDLRGMLDPRRAVSLAGPAPEVAGWHLTADGSEVTVTRAGQASTDDPTEDPTSGGPDADDADQVAADLALLAAVVVTAWRTGATEVRAGDGAAETALRRTRLLAG